MGHDTTYDVRLDPADQWAFDPTGRMLVASSDATLRRRDGTGALDPTFTPTLLPRYPATIAGLEDGALVVGSEVWPEVWWGEVALSNRFVVSHVGATGGVDSELVLPRYVGDPYFAPERLRLLAALPSGDVLLAVEALDFDLWGTDGALIRLERPSSTVGAWTAKWLALAGVLGTPSLDADGSIFIGSSWIHHGGPGWGSLIHIDANDQVVATGEVGPSDPSYRWYAMGRLVPVGDGTALVATSDPRGSGSVLARVWIRP